MHGNYGEYDTCKFYGESNVYGPAHEMLELISEQPRLRSACLVLPEPLAACIPQKDGNR